VIRFCCSNRLETLVDALAENAGAGRASLFDPVHLIVPNPLLEDYVKRGLARRLGIVAHVETAFLRGFLRDLAAASDPAHEIIDRDRLEGALLALFHDPGTLNNPDLGAVRDYLGERRSHDVRGNPDPDSDAVERKRVQLAAELAALFDEYAFSRPEMLATWADGRLVPDLDPPLQRWQRALWLALCGPTGVFAATGAVTLPAFYARTPVEALRPPPALHLFGISYVARLYRSIFASLGRATNLYLYSLTPHRLEAAGGGAEAAAPLDGWARPSRDNVRLLAELPGCQVDTRIVDPADSAWSSAALVGLQRRILARDPGARRPAPDGTVVILPAPDPRRELETIAAEIWTRLRADPKLTLADIAVVVPPSAAPVYLPLAQAVFEEASRLPHTIVDLPRATERRIVEATLALLELPLGSLGRPELLRVAMHPAVARRFPDVDPESWVALCEALEIVRGADAADHAGTYLARDRISWDQGLRRMALGAFLSGRRSGEERPFTLGGETLLPADLPASAEPAARALGILARELIDFSTAARAGAAPFERFAALLRRTLGEMIHPETADEEAALGDVLAVIERVGALVPPALPIGFRTVVDLIAARLGGTPRRHRAPEGVTVASFVPMRALPFRIIFAAGLDEARFPTPARRRALDLRAGAPHPDDITPREQDEHMFLETLLAVRERLYLSYVARDPVTGEATVPSPVLTAVAAAVAPAGAADPLAALARPAPPLTRHEDTAACQVIPAAARERRAAALGASLRRAAGGVRQLPPLGDLRATLGGAWSAVAGEIGWVSPPPAPAGLRARRGLTLADLRRFLECPLQASARVLLPVGDDGDASADAEAALREHERLDESRLETVPFLREIAAELVAGDLGDEPEATVATAYDRAAALKTLEGALPDGLFGRAARARHLGLLGMWVAGIRGAAGGRLQATGPLWLGAAPEHRRDVRLVPPLALALPDGTPLAVGGRTELVARGPDGTRLILSLIGSTSRDYIERDLLGPFFTHLALAAAGEGDQPAIAIVARPGEDGLPRPERFLLDPVSTEAARAYLADLAGELLGNVHAYFLPCEAVFTWKRRRDKGETMGVREAVLFLRDDNWTRFLSDRGPIPDPREYPVPGEADAAAFVARRFGPYLAGVKPEAPGGGRRR
jgi:exodeoxyribonuclease V gamma subunit